MKDLKRFLIYLGGIVAMFALALPALAGSGTEEPFPDVGATFSCTSATYIAPIIEGSQTITVTITDEDGNVLASRTVTVSGTDPTVTVSYPRQESGETLTMTVTGDGESMNFTGTVTDCETTSPCEDGRLNTNLCEPIAIYPIFQSPADVAGLSIWSTRTNEVDNTTGGDFLFYVPGTELQALPDNPEEPLLIEQSANGFATLYKLPDGRFLAQAGPDFEGKVFNFYIDSLTANEVPTVATFFAETQSPPAIPTATPTG